MAAVTVDRIKPVVMGNLRAWVGQIDIAANDDTFESGFTQVLSVHATPAAVADGVIGVTISGSVITFKVGGAINNVQLLVLGQ